jgi:hypothetical protein
MHRRLSRFLMYVLVVVFSASASPAAEEPAKSPAPPVVAKPTPDKKPASAKEKDSAKAKDAAKEKDVVPPIVREERDIEGWRVRIDRRLLEGPAAPIGERAERLLKDKLYELAQLTPAEPLEKLRKVTIVVDLDHGRLTSMQYHPSAGWLTGNGYAADLAKCVHVPSAPRMVDLHHQRVQPWCVLQELAHAYHDQVLGFDNKDVRSAYESAKAGGKYDEVLHIIGHRTKHYALTTPMEYFAELSEACFGTNDFYPFVRGELKEHDPVMHGLLEKIWGKLP